jgi:myo-inositol 2-dehydrogenase / D-chiro-inositol 1-dehydrogenase
VTTAPLRAAVVGAGVVGSIHARALSEHPDVQLVAICARTPTRVGPLAARFGVRADLSLGDLLVREQPDLVCICTGNDDHVEPSLQAIESGAHVFVEKPMAFRLEDARRMVEASESKGVRLGVNFNHRFAETYRRAMAFVRSEAFGRPAYVAIKFAGDLYGILNDPYCMLIETQGHSFDLLRLFGGDIAEVSAFLTDPRGIGVYTSAAISVRFETGAVGSLLGSWDSSYDHPSAVTVEVSGTNGRAVIDNVIEAVRLHRHDRSDFEEWRPGLFRTDQRDFWRTIDTHLAAFVLSVVADIEPPVTGRDGLRALELTYAAIRSFEEGRSVTT